MKGIEMVKYMRRNQQAAELQRERKIAAKKAALSKSELGSPATGHGPIHKFLITGLQNEGESLRTRQEKVNQQKWSINGKPAHAASSTAASKDPKPMDKHNSEED